MGRLRRPAGLPWNCRMYHCSPFIRCLIPSLNPLLMLPALPRSSVRSRGIAPTDMGPFAGLLFLLLSFYLLTSRFEKEVGIVRREQVPYNSNACSKYPEENEALICLSPNQCLSFSVTSPAIQTAAIKLVAEQHKIRLTAGQLAALETLPFLRTDIEKLPGFLSLPTYQRNKLAELEKLAPLNESQVLECIIAAKASAQSLTHRPIYTSLRIDSEVRMSDVQRLFDLLQTQGINRFNLQTQFPPNE
ncbi:MAG: biopolymer transporter ExbD [Hymenobacter sp.]|nr:biopolymer transporter ExbD [Hymenobacter sp.]